MRPYNRFLVESFFAPFVFFAANPPNPNLQSAMA